MAATRCSRASHGTAATLATRVVESFGCCFVYFMSGSSNKIYEAASVTDGSTAPRPGGAATELIDDACLAAGAEREERRGKPGALSRGL
jgi:hypothetical protein